MGALRDLSIWTAGCCAGIAGCNAIFGSDFSYHPAQGGAAGSAGGNGGSGGSCEDGDDDGVCAPDDCDDADPQNFPGNTEICGDFADNDCDDEADDPSLCKGLGTFVSALTGDDAHSGTQAEPLRTVGAGILQAIAIGGGVDVYVAEGSYSEMIALSEDVSLFGGLACSARRCSWERDPAVHVSVLQAVDLEGVQAPSGISRATIVDGFRVVGFGGSASEPYAAALTLTGGAPVIRNNVIIAAQLSDCVGSCEATGVLVRSTARDEGALIAGNVVTAGISPSAASGIAVIQGGVAEIADNRVSGGSGLHAYAVNVDNRASGAPSRVHHNELFAPACSGTEPRHGALRAGGGEVVVDGNLLNLDAAQVGDCAMGCALPAFCAGLQTAGGSLTITNNIAAGGRGPAAAALVLDDEPLGYGSYLVNGNTFAGGGLAVAQSLSAAIAAGVRTVAQVTVGSVRNNLLLGGQSASRYGIYEIDTGNAITLAALDSNAFGGVDVAYRDHDGVSATNYATISDAEGALPDATGNFTSDCNLDLTYHLGQGSSCIDTGTTVEAPPFDIDGDPRPTGSGVDVGADEAAGP